MGGGKGRLRRGSGVLRQGVPPPPWASPGAAAPEAPAQELTVSGHTAFVPADDMKLGCLSCGSLKLEGFFTDTKLICPITLSEPHHNLTKRLTLSSPI